MSYCKDQSEKPDAASSEDLNYLTESISGDDKQVLGNIRQMADHLKELAQKAMEAEAIYKQVQQEYDTYRYQTLPAAMLSVGVQSVMTSDGSKIEVKNKFYCNPNKNDSDRVIIGQWLTSHGASHLIKKQALVDGAQLDALKSTGVPYVEKWDMNTNSLKAWIKDNLGVNGGLVKFSIGDIPPAIHFIQVDEVELTV